MRVFDREKLRSDLTRMAWERIDKGEIKDSYIIMDIHRGDSYELIEIAEKFGVEWKSYNIEIDDEE